MSRPPPDLAMLSVAAHSRGLLSIGLSQGEEIIGLRLSPSLAISFARTLADWAALSASENGEVLARPDGSMQVFSAVLREVDGALDHSGCDLGLNIDVGGESLTRSFSSPVEPVFAASREEPGDFKAPSA